MQEAWRVIQQDYPILFWGTLYTAALLVVSLGLLAIDQRLVTGVNPWLKPVKFEVSIMALNATVAVLLWLLRSQSPERTSTRLTGAVVGAAMLIEITAIVVQAARGVPSHYNMSSALNTAIFNLMAFAIVFNTLAIAWLGVLYAAPQPHLAPAVTWGIRLGIALLVLSSLQGFLIVRNGGHTVGAHDGGPGLPFLRWSTTAGDLRVAHFIGMHGIQVLPLLGYLVSRTNRQAGTEIVAFAFALMSGLFVWTLGQAWSGRPLIR